MEDMEAALNRKKQQNRRRKTGRPAALQRCTPGASLPADGCPVPYGVLNNFRQAAVRDSPRNHSRHANRFGTILNFTVFAPP